MKGLVEALRERFVTARGATVDGRFGAVGAMREALLGGVPCDVMIVTEAMLARAARPRRGRGPAVRADRRASAPASRRASARPCRGSTSADALKAALLAAPAIYLPDTVQSTAGQHVAAVLARLGIAAETAARLSRPSQRRHGDARPRRERRAGRARLHPGDRDPLHPGLTLAGPLPEPFGLATVYAAGVASGATEPALAAAFIELLPGEGAAAERRAGGFEPVAR